MSDLSIPKQRPVPVRADITNLERILAELDADLRYEQKYGADVYGGPRVLSCGCEPSPFVSCDWHKHVQESLDDAKDIITSYDTIGPFRWSALRKDYCGCGECRCPTGHGSTEEAALADLYEQEES